MSTPADKTPKNKTAPALKNKPAVQHRKASDPLFTDNRPAAIAQRKRQEMANQYIAQNMRPFKRKTIKRAYLIS